MSTAMAESWVEAVLGPHIYDRAPGIAVVGDSILLAKGYDGDCSCCHDGCLGDPWRRIRGGKPRVNTSFWQRMNANYKVAAEGICFK